MNTKQIQTTLKDLQRRLELLEQQSPSAHQYGQSMDVERRLEEMQRQKDDRRLQTLRKTAGALARLTLDPVAWQKKQRKQWSKHMKKQLVIAATAIEWRAPLFTRNKKDFKGIPGLEFYDL